VFAIDARTGALSRLGKDLPTDSGPRSVAIDPDGGFARVTHSLAATFGTYAIDWGTGALKTVSVVSTRQRPAMPAIVAGAKPLQFEPQFAWATSWRGLLVSAFRTDAATGRLVSSGDTPQPTIPNTVAVDHDGHFAYTADAGGFVES